jgi:dienelactone hydrolase
MPEPATATRRRNFSPWAQWQLELAALPPAPLLPRDRDGIAGRRDEVRAVLARWFGPDPVAVPPDLEVLATTDCGPYRREAVVFDVESAMSVPAYLLVPHARRAPGPAVLAVHGHGPGKDEVCGVVPSADARGDYAHALAMQGYVVLAPDLRCFGERADWQPEDHYHCDVNLVHAVMAGKNPLAQNLWDLRRALDVLAAHPLVDATRIGAVGFSYGATMTLFLAAVDERVKAAVVSAYLSSWRAAHRVPWNMCGSQVAVGMLGDVEHADIAALVAPRALLVETGSDDPIFPEAAARDTVAQLAPVWAALGAPEGTLEHDVFAGGHEWHGARAGAFLERTLGLPESEA